LTVTGGVLLAVAGVSIGWVIVRASGAGAGTLWMRAVSTEQGSFETAPDRPFFFLVICRDEPGLMDGIHVIGLNPALHAGTILNISYDTLGPNGGKIDEVTSAAGLRREADAVSQLVGVPLPVVVGTTFDGFAAMVDEIGGIDINIPKPLHDPFSGADFNAGPQHIDGAQAVSFGRDRMDFATGDLERAQNGGVLILSALATLEARHPGFAETLRYVATLGRHVEMDGTSLAQLYELGRYALTIDPANLRNVLLPVRDGPGTLLIPTPDASSLLADFAVDGVLRNH
jgi:LCP family protein required for cell wall assembly